MKKLLGIVVLGLIICNITYAKKNTNTWDYPFLVFDKFETKGSQDFYKFDLFFLFLSTSLRINA